MKKCLWGDCNNQTDNPKFCSLRCSVKFQRRYLTKPWVGVNVCEQCGKKFSVNSGTKNKKFCNRSCSARYNNLSRMNTRCLNCNQLLRYGKRYCSNECGSDYRYKKFIKDWLSGKLEVINDYGINSRIRRYMLEEAGYRCSSPNCCVVGGWQEINPKTGKSPLTVDHIDGNASNNKKENLRVLCPNCHSLTPTYCSLNAGNGRAWRRERERRITGVA